MSAVTAAAIGIAAMTTSITDTDLFIQHLNTQVLETIQKTENLPEMSLSAEEFEILKKGMTDRWNAVVKNGVLDVVAEDKEVRPSFVGLQCIIETVLSNELNAKRIENLRGVIYTPAPATPVCNEPKTVYKESVDGSIEADPSRLFTVKARTVSVRDLLKSEETKLYIVYPKSGLNKRSEEQREVYQRELSTHSNLIDYPLTSTAVRDDLVGAFYIFESAGKRYAFAIKMSQALEPKNQSSGLWFGEVTRSSPVNGRICVVASDINSNSPGAQRLEL